MRHDCQLAPTSAAPAVTVSAETAQLAASARGTPVPRRRALLRRRLREADAVAGALAGAVAGLAGGADLLETALAAAAGAAACPLGCMLVGLYVDDLRAWVGTVADVPRLLLAGLLLSWPMLALLDGLAAPHPALGAVSVAGATAAGTGATRAAARAGCRRSGAYRERVLVVGSGAVAAAAAARLRADRRLGLDPIGYVDDVHHGNGVLGPRLGDLSALERLIATRQVDRVLVAFSRASHAELLGCIRTCREAGVPVDVVPRLFEVLDDARPCDAVGGLPLLTLGAPELSSGAAACKRMFDLGAAALMLVLLAPVMLLIALAIKVDSPGPILYTQRRSGRGGAFFTLYKFRSMRRHAPVLVQASGAIVKLEDDDRLTRVGRVIRRFSLDEAPQLFNVLRGEMSLVGPRPLVEAEQRSLGESWQHRRADVRPGLTGRWQTAGRSHVPFEDMISLDYQYVMGWSLARDVKILLATIPAVLS
ncbi:MAG TPA: exopolysaccharide biosynthesis polyprenyl glycosylphosphotransferase, partial [Gaiellaceae bacterium]|nr:exopolysaccharide biosynthesis polyprenyl glycosylphosphotransferase [Gaiellaceae bacterium]